MKTKYNSMSFSAEDIENGLLDKLLKYFIEYNEKSNEVFMDVHMWTDGTTTVVDWFEHYYDDCCGDEKFEFVDDQHVVMRALELPDESTIYLFDEECDEYLNNWLKEHPTYKKNMYGRWYDEREQIEFEEQIAAENANKAKKQKEDDN